MSFPSFALRSALPVLIMAAAIAGVPDRAKAGAQPYLGDIMIVGFGFCPVNWAIAQGQLLPIAQNQALFSLLGIQYGGDGRTTFALPDLRGRATIGQGSGPGLTPYTQGDALGAERRTMTSTTMAGHSHTVNATNSDGDFPGPGDKLLAAAPTGGSGNETIYADTTPDKAMASSMISLTGGGQPFPVMDPSLALTHCIALQGIFPPRN